MPASDRRGLRRLPLRCRGSFISGAHPNQIPVQATDVSAGGVFLVGDTHPEVGEKVRVRLIWGSDPINPTASFEALGKVIWVDGPDSKRPGFAVEFNEILEFGE